jgi:hypothetical protein
MAIARQSGTPAGAPSPAGDAAPLPSIFRKAAAISTRTVLVFGAPSSGKSSWVRDDVVKSGLNPLWLGFNNTAALVGPDVGEWDVATPANWDVFHKQVVVPMQQRVLTGYTAVVLDGLDVLLQYALSSLVSAGKTPERAEWSIASKQVWSALLALRDAAGSLYATVDVVADPQSGTRKLNMNPYAKNLLLPLLAEKVFVGIKRVRGVDNRPTGEVVYAAQTNPALALEFVLP